MDLFITLFSFIWQHTKFILVDHSLSLLSSIHLPHVALANAERIIISNDRDLLKEKLKSVKEIRHGDETKPFIALTFDDGFDPEEARNQLKILAEKQVLATFFLKGWWMKEEKGLVAEIIAAGHELGNHSYNHPKFPQLSLAQIKEEIDSPETLTLADHNYSLKPYFRFPYGARTPQILQVVNESGYTSILWDIDSLDWLQDGKYVKNEVLSKAHNGSIILLHLGKKETGKVLAAIIDELRAKGFILVTVSELLNQDDALLRRS
ncbi:MAG: polysaccharide deacetylase family protein [Candidatus Abawacabacteria bacterium]|nr:polysaccharide deacetylase family protein [Candidatus Abawacabacteria bacterium]